MNFKKYIILKSKQKILNKFLGNLRRVANHWQSVRLCWRLFSFIFLRFAALSRVCVYVYVCGVVNSTWSQTVSERDTNTRSYIWVCVLATRSSSSVHFNSISIRFDSIHVENATQNRWKIQMLRSHFVCCCRCQPLRTKTTTITTKTRHQQQQQQLQQRRQHKSTNAVKS